MPTSETGDDTTTTDSTNPDDDTVDTEPNPDDVTTGFSCDSVNVPIYELTPNAYTALQQVWAPLDPSAETKLEMTLGDLHVTDHDAFEENGLGCESTPGVDWIDHRELAPNFRQGDETLRRSLLYIWQAADPQIIDEESPIRFEAFTSLYRPQGHLMTQVFEAHVRSARRLAQLSDRPFDFALLAGDLTDGSQKNEIDWLLTILNGGVIDPDSGIDDDPVPGPGNDYNDPFCSDGLAAPWYAVLGNHDSLYNGGFGVIDDELRAASVGSEIYQHALFRNGFRDGSTANGDVVTEGTTPADDNRLALQFGELLHALHHADGHPHGHGLTQDDVSAEKGYFSVNPVPGKPIRLIALNTVDPTADLGIGHMGSIDVAQFDWLKAELTAADQRHELIIILSHHRTGDIAFTSPVSGDELVAELSASAGVVLHVTGHGHQNEKQIHEGSASHDHAHGYWELMLASTLDFPMQSRIIELVAEGNGYLSIYITNFGHNSPENSLAHKARHLAGAKLAFLHLVDGVDDFWEDDLQNQNLLLRIPIPQGVQNNLMAHDWPSSIASEETLKELRRP